MDGIIGRKLGMTRVFEEDGRVVPVTVIEAGPCPGLQVHTPANGRWAVQLGFGQLKPKRSSKPKAGHAKKAGLETVPVGLKEFGLAPGTEAAPAPGQGGTGGGTCCSGAARFPGPCEAFWRCASRGSGAAMLEALHFTAAGQRKGSHQLPAEYDGVINQSVLYQAVRTYRNNQRHGTHSTKTRGLVSGGNQKPWGRKGTGRARQGSIRAPQWPGGGTGV